MTIHYGTVPQVQAQSIEITIAPGQFWRHYKGRRYYVCSLALDEATLTWNVHYRGADGGPFWLRPLSVWMGMARDENGELVKRFTLETTP